MDFLLKIIFTITAVLIEIRPLRSCHPVLEPMLPLFYTRQFVLDRLSAKRANRPQSMIYSAENNLFAVRRVDTAAVTEKRSTLVFECDLHQGVRDQKVFFGLMETETVGITSNSPGIGVAVDLQTGLVTDVVNDLGVIGYLENPPGDAGAPVHVTVELEVIGHVVLPRIRVGADEILHPALYLDTRGGLSALVGTSVYPLGDARFENARLHPAAACEVLTAH